MSGVRGRSHRLTGDEAAEIRSAIAGGASFETRFWRRVDRSAGSDACWPWLGYVDDDGYGRTGNKGTNGRAHRYACLLAHGEPLFSGAQACHSTSCTTRACCNPTHLRWDTVAGNQADVAIVGSRRGERNPKARLGVDQVREIWERREESPTALAIEFGVSRGAIRHILLGLNWRHVTGAISGTVRVAAAAALLLLALSAVGCGDLLLSNETLCRSLCAPRAVRSFTAGTRCQPAQCVCETAQPDGGLR